MVLRSGKGYDPFYGCMAYPQCKGARAVHEDGGPCMVEGEDEDLEVLTLRKVAGYG